MLAKIKTILILILMGGIAYLLFQGSTFLDNKLENKPTQWVQDEPVIAPVTQTPKEVTVVVDAPVVNLKVTDSPEIDNFDYGWLQGRIDGCHPTMKREVKAAMDNDGMIRKDEYSTIMNKCVDFNEQESAGDKAELKRFLAE